MACGSSPSLKNGTSVPHQETSVAKNGTTYVDSVECTECHRDVFDDWSGSHHDLAMQHATTSSVLADFDDATFTHFGITSTFFTRDARFFVRTEGPGGKLGNFEITHTLGVEPLQQYLVSFPGGRLQSLAIAWNTAQKQWFHLYPNEQIPFGNPMHWTGRYQTWNVMCAECHSTNLRKNYDSYRDTYNTVWDEIDVGCQACHGPGNKHVTWARAGTDGDNNGLVVDLARTAAIELDVCAGCHSRRQRITDVDQHAQPFLDNFRPSTLQEDLYHADGQIQDEVYVWGSFTQSKMHAAGVRCTNCHNPHSLHLRAEGNAVCTQCHQENPSSRFPMLQAKRYDTREHHFHEPTSTGAQCINCHMPEKTYMVVDPRRDHSFRIPRPDLSTSIGAPNTCSACHDDQSDTWAAEQAVAWWGASDEVPHYGEIFSAARAGDRTIEADLVTIVRNHSNPAIVRATALEHLRQYGTLGLQEILAAVRDDNPFVRAAASAGLDRLSLEQRVAALVPLLDDPIRNVRIEAVRALIPVPRTVMSLEQTALFDHAVAEFVQSQMVAADTPGAHLNLGVFHTLQGDLEEATQDYLTALRLDPFFLPARFNLASLYNRQGLNNEAETTLRNGLDRTPNEGELHYSLGLLLAELQRLDEAMESLRRAADLIPTRARVRYNYGLALQQLGRVNEAEAALIIASQIDPTDTDILVALAKLLMSQAAWDRARHYTQVLLELNPGAPEVQQLFNEIQVRELNERAR